MKIHIISIRSVFSSDAVTNRMLSLAKGLAVAGHEVIVLCSGRAGSADHEKCSGTMDGFSFTHLGWKPGLYPDSWVGKARLRFNSLVDGIKWLKKNEHPDALLLLSSYLTQIIPYLWTARSLSIPVFHESSEYPHHHIRTWRDRIFLSIYLRYIIPRFAGVALMTKALMRYFKENCPRCPPTLHLPMTVDPERFMLETVPPIAGRYIAHCGTSFGDKDGVMILVEAFTLISTEFPDVKLVLIGSDAVCGATEHLQQRIQSLGLQERILLTGLVPRDDMPAWLQHAELLALARPANLQAAGGFPTKLGEYLVSARPVVVTRVGEIADYLQNGVSAWFAEPGSVESFAEKLREVLSLDAAARNAVGLRGRGAALTVFNSTVQGRRFAQFIEEQVAVYRTKLS